MRNAIARYACFALAAVVSVVAGMAAPALTGFRGSIGPSILGAEAPIRAIIAVILVTGLALVPAILLARVANAAVGLFGLGMGLFGFAYRVASAESFAFAAPLRDGFAGSAWLLALECAIGAVLVGAAAWIVIRVAPLEDVQPTVDGHRPDPFLSPDAWRALGVAVVALPVAWLVARSTDRGQAIAAAFTGAMVAGLVGRLIAPHLQPSLLFAAPVLWGAVGYAIAAWRLGPVSMADAYVEGALPAFLRVLPIDWIVGAPLGVAVGLGWARSFLHHEDTPSPAPASG